MRKSYCLLFIITLFSLVLLGGCEESGIHYSHSNHIERGLSDCNICHNYKEDMEPKWPKMAKCLSCHMKKFDTTNPESCLYCHTKPGMKIKVKHDVPKKYKDLNFSHKTHLEKNVECKSCHEKIETSDAITVDLFPSMFTNCVPCHKKQGEEKIACNVCHKHIKNNRMPLYHEDRWVKHDDARWIQKHGSEFYYNKDYCQRCHVDLNWCVDCHRDQKPRNHNNAWRRKTHGFAASWERKKCSVCHLEDFCERCHSNTKPLNHTASWGGSNTRNRHCTNCHFPISMVSCTVCHPDPEHPTADDSPHPPFAGDCNECHPINRAGEAPHPDAFGVKCTACHRR